MWWQAFETLNFKSLSINDWCSAHARRSEMRDRLPPDLCDLLENCLQVDPNLRIEASEALSHEFFKSVQEKVAHDLGFSPPIKYVTP
jgi:serine/threonine protein kinase